MSNHAAMLRGLRNGRPGLDTIRLSGGLRDIPGVGFMHADDLQGALDRQEWRLVGPDTPEGEWLLTWLAGEDRPTLSMLRRCPNGGADEWIAEDGRTTVTHRTYPPPTHWTSVPPLPMTVPVRRALPVPA